MGKSRKEIAIEHFKEGYGCAQSVFVTFADVCSIERDTALRLASSLGGGMGRMREVCGTVSAMALVAGMMTGSTKPKDIEAKKHTYDIVQKLAKEFREQHGSIVCKELLGLVKQNKDGICAASFQDTTPEKRTEEYYKKRPCVELVGCAAEILEKNFLSKEEREDENKSENE